MLLFSHDALVNWTIERFFSSIFVLSLALSEVVLNKIQKKAQ